MTREEAIRNLHVLSTVAHPILAEACTVGIAALREQPQWISVEERLPEDDVQVLACTKHGKAFSAHCERGRWRVSGSVKVTHWMHLPEAPKEAT